MNKNKNEKCATNSQQRWSKFGQGGSTQHRIDKNIKNIKYFMYDLWLFGYLCFVVCT